MGAELVILIPVLGRPATFAPLLNSIYATTASVDVLFLASPGLGARFDRDELDRLNAWWVEVPWLPEDGDYARKINLGATLTDHEWIFMGATDLRFHEHWFEHAKDQRTGRVLAVGTNDLCNPRVISGRHSTHSLVHRDYVELGTIDEPGKLLHEGYPHEFVDDEFVETARRRRRWAHAHMSWVEHLHPMCGKAEVDPIYAAHAERIRRGRTVFRRRSVLWR